MRKMKKLLLLVGVMVLCLGSLTACGGGSSSKKKTEAKKEEKKEADITGKWTITEIEDADGNSYTLEEYCEKQGVDAKGLECTYDFDGEKTVTADIGGVSAEGTYKFDGEKITVTFDGKDSVLSYDEKDDYIYTEDKASGMVSYMDRKE